MREGEASIRVTASGGDEATVRVEVTHLVNDLPVSFPNEVVPLLTKHGCNAGGCQEIETGQQWACEGNNGTVLWCDDGVSNTDGSVTCFD